MINLLYNYKKVYITYNKIKYKLVFSTRRKTKQVIIRSNKDQKKKIIKVFQKKIFFFIK